MRAAGILHPDLVESGVVQRRNPFAPFFSHLGQRVVHITIVFEQVQRFLYGPLDLWDFVLSCRRAARIAHLLRLPQRLHVCLPGLRKFAPELILEHLKHLHMGIPNSLTRVDHHGFAHQPDAEPFERVEQLRELQRRKHPVLHHGAVVDEQIAVAFVPQAARRVVVVAERDLEAVVLAATAVETAGAVQPERQHHAPAPLLLRGRRIGIGLTVGGELHNDLPFV